jgi:hypothetical protein
VVGRFRLRDIGMTLQSRSTTFARIREEAPPGMVWLADVCRRDNIAVSTAAAYCEKGLFPGAVKPFDRRWYAPEGFRMMKNPNFQRGSKKNGENQRYMVVKI